MKAGFSHGGAHGYDNDEPDMRGIFAARGPNFKENYTIDSLRNVNLYQIMCALLNITPSPHNGTWSEISQILVDVPGPKSRDEAKYFSHRSKSTTAVVLSGLALTSLLFIVACGVYYQWTELKAIFLRRHRNWQHLRELST